MPRGVSNRWTGFSTGTWDWNVGLDYSTGMWDWNVGLEHFSHSVASSLRASYSLAVPVVWQFCGPIRMLGLPSLSNYVIVQFTLICIRSGSDDRA